MPELLETMHCILSFHFLSFPFLYKAYRRLNKTQLPQTNLRDTLPHIDSVVNIGGRSV